MTTPPPIPQDVIDEIMIHLHNDPSTLKVCSLVSHSFFPPCRRQLFSRILLETPRSVLRLRRLLKRSREISYLVFTIHIHIIPGVTIPDLPIVLSHFMRLRHLIIGNDDYYFDWGYISPEIAGSIQALIVLGALHSLKFICVYHVPTSLIRVASTIKTLSLESSVLYEDTDTSDLSVAPLTHLESLHLGFEVMLGLNHWDPFTTPNLRQISMLGTEKQTLQNAQHVLVAASESIQDIIWHEYSVNPFISRRSPNIYPKLHLKILPPQKALTLI